MKKAKDLSRAERLEIGILLLKRYSLRSIAASLERSPNTISYEVRENSTSGRYEPLKAHAKAHLRKRMRRLEFAKIEEYPALKRFIIEKLAEHWNPDEIAGFLKRHPKEYRGMYQRQPSTNGYDGTRRALLHTSVFKTEAGTEEKGKKTKRVMIPNRVDIAERFKGATNRTRFGHFEDDTLMGARYSGRAQNRLGAEESSCVGEKSREHEACTPRTGRKTHARTRSRQKRDTRQRTGEQSA